MEEDQEQLPAEDMGMDRATELYGNQRQAPSRNPQSKGKKGPAEKYLEKGPPVQADTREMGYTWNLLERRAQDRELWRGDGLNSLAS